MERFDAHGHIPADHAESAEFFAAMDLRLVNIAFAHLGGGDWRGEQVWGAAGLVRAAQGWPERFAWCTGFDLPRWDDPGWADAAIRGIDADFEKGAVAVKVWKDFGMRLRNPSGAWVQVDDPVLEPVFAHLEKTGRTVLMHVGDSKKHWEPGMDGDHAMHGKQGAPSNEDIMAARDRVLERHPKLKVIGCHLGCMEDDLGAIAQRLDRFPNFAVDSSARVMALAGHDRGKVREFFAKYRDRILYGADQFSEKPHSVMTQWERCKELSYLRFRYLEEFEFYESGSEMLLQGWELIPKRIRGLGLPGDVLDSFYRGNALKWLPALAGKGRG